MHSIIILECSDILENANSQNSTFFVSTCSTSVRVEKRCSLILYYESLSQASGQVVCYQLFRYQCCQSVTGIITNQSPFCWNVSFISSKMLVEARRPCHGAGSPNVLGQLCCFWYPARYTIQLPFANRFYPEEGPQCKLNKNQPFPSEKNKQTNKQKPTKNPKTLTKKLRLLFVSFKRFCSIG